MSWRVWRAAGVLVVAVAVAATAMRPLLWRPGALPRYVDVNTAFEQADRNLNVWILAWAAHAAVADPAHLFDGNVFFPARNALAGSESMLAHLPVTVSVWAATHDATSVLKAEMLWGIAGTWLAVFLLVWFHTRAAWVAAIAASAVALEPGRLNPLGIGAGMAAQPQYLGFQFAPLALLALGWWASGAAPVLGPTGLAVALAGQALACFYLGYYAFLTVPLYGAVLWWGRSRRAWVTLALAVGAGGALVLPAASHYLAARAMGAVREPDPRLAFLGSLGGAGLGAGAAWLGPVILILGAIAVAGRLRHDTRPAVERAAWVLVLAALVLALGPTLVLPGGVEVPMPHRLLVRVVPGFGMVRGPLRALSLAGLGLSLAGALSLARIGAVWPRAVRAGVGVAGVMAAIGWVAPTPVPIEPDPLGRDLPPVYRWLAMQPRGGGVLEVPGAAAEEDLAGLVRESRYMLYATVHWQPLLNGYTAYPPVWSGLAKSLARRLPESDALQTLVNVAPLSWMILHRSALPAAARAQWERDAPAAGLVETTRFGDDVVYRVMRAPTADWRAAVGAPAGMPSLEGTSTAPLAASCRQATISAAFPAEMRVVIGVRAVSVTVTNTSPCPWPGLGVRPEGLVVLRAEWIGPTPEQLAPALTSRLPHDVAPGASVTADALVLLPRAPGDYVLRVALAQEGVPGVLASADGPVRVSPGRTE